MRRIDSGFRRLIAYAAGGVALLVFALFLNALFTAQSQTGQTASSASGDPFGTAFFNEEGDDTQPAWSPDGKYLAYVSTRTGIQELYVRDLQTSATTLVASPGGSPVWSPDGTQLAYMRQSADTSGGIANDLYVTDFLGAQHIKVNDTPNPTGVKWLPDSRSIVFSVRRGSGEIHVVSADGASARTIHLPTFWTFSVSSLTPDGRWAIGNGFAQDTRAPTGLVKIDVMSEGIMQLPVPDISASGAQLSPDNQSVAYFVPDSNPSAGSTLVVARLDGSESHIMSGIGPGYVVGPVAWSPDSRFIAYTTAIGYEAADLIIAWADGSRYVRVPDLQVNSFTWSPDGTQMAVSARHGDQYDIALIRADEQTLLTWLATAEATATPAPPNLPSPFPLPTPLQDYDFYHPTRLTNDAGGDYRPAVSPDGRRVAFASERDGNWDIYVLDMATGAQTRLTDDPNPDMAPSWSPDGARIAYQHNSPDPGGPVLVDRVVMNSDGSGKTLVSSGAVWIGNEAPAWSPSGDRIAFGDGVNVVVVGVTDGAEIARFAPPSSPGALYQPAWIDDTQVAFVGDGALMVGDTRSGVITPVTGVPGLAWLPMTTRAYPRIGYFSLEGSRIRLMSVFPNGNEPYTLAQFGANQVQHAAWSPDGRFIAYYADDSIHVAIAWSEQYRDSAPLFTIPTSAGLTDLNSLAWLPDSSGFVYVAASDGQPNLYLATLNQSAIQIYVDEYPKYAPFPGPTPPLPPTPAPTPTAWELPPGAPTPFPTPAVTVAPGKPPYWLQLIRHFGGVQVVVSGQYVWLVDENNNALFSFDAGATWSSISLPPDTQQLAVWPRFDGTDMYAATGQGIYRASLDRRQWQPVLTGGPYAGVSVSGDGTLFAAERLDCRVHRSTDGGATWIASTVFTNNAPDGCLLMCVIVSPDAADGSIVYALTQLHGLWRSTDRGQTWQLLGGEYWFDAAADPADPSLIYAAHGETLMRFDTNGGARNAAFKLSFAGALAVGPDQTVYYGDAGGRVFASRDQGATWSEISTFSGEPIRSIVAVDQIVYVLTEGSLIGGYWEGAPVPATQTPTP